MRRVVLALVMTGGLTNCATPPPAAYVGSRAGESVGVGQNASGESCNQLQGGAPDLVNIYCGTWTQPAARVRAGGPVPKDGLRALAAAGEWRQGLDLRYACGSPEPTTVLGGHPAVLLRCVRRVGGWRQIALAADIEGRVWLADGILPSLPVMERSIGVLSGQAAAGATTLPRSAADTLLANQLAAHAFSAGDVGEYEQAMAVGARANLADNFAAAEAAYRAAVVLQQKALGRNNPDTVTPLMHLALQISDQGRFAESDALFRQADGMAPRATDKGAVARLLHYRALDATNQVYPSLRVIPTLLPSPFSGATTHLRLRLLRKGASLGRGGGTMASSDAMRERIAAHPWPCGGVEVVRANRGYTLYSRRTRRPGRAPAVHGQG